MPRRLGGRVAALLALPGCRDAQDYPTRPVTMVIPFAAGGPTDVLGRVVAARMSEILGQQVVVENVGGAGGMTGAKRVATAAPDGYQMRARHGRHAGAGPDALQEAALQFGRPTSRRSRCSPKCRSS